MKEFSFVVIGDSGVGKSALAAKYSTGNFC